MPTIVGIKMDIDRSKIWISFDLAQRKNQATVNQQHSDLTEMTKQVDILEKYGEMINLIPDIVCLTNKNHIITHCNERLLEQLGIERKEIIGTSGMNFLTKESQEKIIKIISQPEQRGRI